MTGKTTQELIEQSERLLNEGNLPAARPLALEAAERCEAEQIPSARAHMVLATLSFRSGKLDDVFAWCERALQREPGLPLAFMNMSAAAIEAKDYGRSIELAEQGLAQPSAWSAKLQHNLGLAKFKRAVESQSFERTREAEPHFQASLELDPRLSGNHYFLGVIEENVKNDARRALELFRAGCEAGDVRACEAHQTLLRKAQPQVGTAAGGATSEEEEALWEELTKKYVARGLSRAQAEQALSGVRASFTAMPAAVRVPALKSMVQALG